MDSEWRGLEGTPGNMEPQGDLKTGCKLTLKRWKSVPSRGTEWTTTWRWESRGAVRQAGLGVTACGEEGRLGR